MPIFDYQCIDCGKIYEIFLKNREIEEDILCPSCSSRKHKKIFSTISVTMSKSNYQTSESNPCHNCYKSDNCRLR